MCALVSVLAAVPVSAALQVGAAVVDITPPTLPVIVNGGFFSRTVDRVKTPLKARALALAEGRERVVIMVVDSCMLGRPLLDEIKALAAVRTGVATNRMLIAATHTHSAPSAFSCLGTEADPGYVPFLRERLVEALVAAQRNLEPAQVGWAKVAAPDFTALRRWIRRPDRLAEDPFGQRTVRANMHAGSNWDDVTGESGPEDPDLALVSFQALDGRPLAVLANYSMHYFSDNDLSADYFGLFCEGLKARCAPETVPGRAPFVGILSHGCSGDIWRVDYKVPERERPKPTIEEYTHGLLELATQALAEVRYRADAELAMVERRITLAYRVPDPQRLEWARRLVAELGGRAPTTLPQVYALEQIALHERQQTEVVVQALRLGDLAIATTPTETYALTGLKIKAASPLPQTMVIELANGGDGYIPPPEQHLFGGYNTWPARSAGLEVTAEPKIAEAAIGLLERVTGQGRRPWQAVDGPAARAVLAARPYAYWRLDEFAGPLAADATGQGRDAVYEAEVAYHLEGAHPAVFGTVATPNRAVHLVGGRVLARVPVGGDRYTVSMWIWNGMPEEGRAVSGWFFSRGPDHGLSRVSEHLGVGGRSANPGRLIFFGGEDASGAVAGQRMIPRWEWRHVALVRDGARVRVYLHGQLEIETTTAVPGTAGLERVYIGGRSDRRDSWEGRVDEVAWFDRGLGADEVKRLAWMRP